jgi:hypothetical protein
VSGGVSAITIRFDLPTQFLDLREQRAGFVVLVAFLVSFLFIRTSARLMRSPKVPWWPGSVTTEGGLHLHHLVWGIVLLLLSGFLGFVTKPSSPRTEILAGLFGVGAGLTLDEFALWIYLKDVYWAEEGRASFEAVIVAAVVGGLIVLGVAPFDVPHDNASVDTLALVVALDVGLAAAAILKGRPILGLIGIFLPFVSLFAVLRLASPGSPWARKLYDPDGRRMARATARFERGVARRKRLSDLIAGAPEAS